MQCMYCAKASMNRLVGQMEVWNRVRRSIHCENTGPPSRFSLDSEEIVAQLSFRSDDRECMD